MSSSDPNVISISLREHEVTESAPRRSENVPICLCNIFLVSVLLACSAGLLWYAYARMVKDDVDGNLGRHLAVRVQDRQMIVPVSEEFYQQHAPQPPTDSYLNMSWLNIPQGDLFVVLHNTGGFDSAVKLAREALTPEEQIQRQATFLCVMTASFADNGFRFWTEFRSGYRSNQLGVNSEFLWPNMSSEEVGFLNMHTCVHRSDRCGAWYNMITVFVVLLGLIFLFVSFYVCPCFHVTDSNVAYGN